MRDQVIGIQLEAMLQRPVHIAQPRRLPVGHGEQKMGLDIFRQQADMAFADGDDAGRIGTDAFRDHRLQRTRRGVGRRQCAGLVDRRQRGGTRARPQPCPCQIQPSIFPFGIAGDRGGEMFSGGGILLLLKCVCAECKTLLRGSGGWVGWWFGWVAGGDGGIHGPARWLQSVQISAKRYACVGEPATMRGSCLCL